MGTGHTIELNGTSYDAVTGKMIANAGQHGHKKAKSAADIHQHIAASPSHKKVLAVDGFKMSRLKKRPVLPTKQANDTTTLTSTSRKAKRTRNSAARHPAQVSTTLMRLGVKKPTAATRKIRRANVPAGSLVNHQVRGSQKESLIDTQRLEHASRVSKSTKIYHFKSPRSHGLFPKLQPLAVATPPKGDSEQAGLAATTKPTKQSAAAREQTQRRAHRHKKGSVHSRLLVTGIGVALLAIVSVIGYKNIAGIDIKFVSLRAGINAVLPSYLPAGYHLDSPIEYETGLVKLSYSMRGGAGYSVIQETSSWDSQSLRANYLSTVSGTYLTVPIDGRTVYVFDNESATWVTNGIWFRVVNNTALTNTQLLKLINST